MPRGRPPIILTTSDGRSDTLDNWAKSTGINRSTILYRLRTGLSTDKALELDGEEKGTRKYTKRELTVNGQALPIAEWARLTGISYATIKWRILQGWPDDAVVAPDKQRRGLVEFQGRMLSQREIARQTGIPLSTLQRRLADGWSMERALGPPTQPKGRGKNT